MLFIYDPDCQNCQMVKSWLDKHSVIYTERNVHSQPVTAEELLDWSELGKLPLKAFIRPEKFSLKAIMLSNQITAMVERDICAHIIAGAPQFIPHPMMVGDDFVVMGMDNAQWRKALNIMS